jgi:hypothetical protein
MSRPPVLADRPRGQHAGGEGGNPAGLGLKVGKVCGRFTPFVLGDTSTHARCFPWSIGQASYALSTRHVT